MYLGTYLPATIIAIVTVSLAFGAFAQQSIRTPEGPQYQKLTPLNVTTSFLRIGPFSGTAGVDAGYSFNDNANTTETQKISSNQFAEGLDLDLTWMLSPFNRVDLTLGGQVQENFFSNGKNTINLAIFPVSQINLQASVGDVLLRAFEHFAIVQDPVTDPVISGETNLNRLTNTIGVGASVPLYPLDLGLEFDYTYSSTLGSTNASGTSSSGGGGIRNSFRLGATLGLGITSFASCGIEFNGTTNYGAGANDIDALSVGPFLRGRLTRLIEVDSGIGPLLEGPQSLSQTAYYAYLSVRYEITPISELIAGISHDVNFSAGLNITENNNFHLVLRTSAARRWTLFLAPFLNFGTAESGLLLGPYTQYGVDIRSSFHLSAHLIANIQYRFVKRDSGEANGRYQQNTIGLSIGYGF
jgi:hypothetical protein